MFVIDHLRQLGTSPVHQLLAKLGSYLILPDTYTLDYSIYRRSRVIPAPRLLRLAAFIMSLLNLLPDILPMIMPSEVQVTKASDLEAQRAGRDSAMIRQGAVIGRSDKMCASGEFASFPP